MNVGKGDAKKASYWQQTLGEAARSGLPIREFCRRRRLKESQFYWWQHRLRMARPEGATSKPGARESAANFALVSEEGLQRFLDDFLGSLRRLCVTALMTARTGVQNVVIERPHLIFNLCGYLLVALLTQD